MHAVYVLILAGVPGRHAAAGVRAAGRASTPAGGGCSSRCCRCVVVFGAWDVAAIHARWWHYDPRYLVGVTLPGRLPLEELLFFLVIPTCAVLTLEAVRARRPDWLIGDEGA